MPAVYNEGPLAVICGIAYPYRGHRLSKAQFSWPFARATLLQDRIILAPRGPFAIAGKKDIPYQAVTVVEIVGNLGGISVEFRFRSANPDVDGVSLTAWRRDAGRINEALAARGVNVDESS